ncbi:hypothetical protein Tco_0669974 [Tanacetum coccineum]
MEVNIEEDENESELTYPYEEVDPLNPLSHASESEPDDETEVENLIEHEDETVLVSVYEVGESSTTAIPREDGDIFLPGFMRRDINSLFRKAKDKFYGKLILDLGNEVHSSVEQGTAAMEKLVEKLGNTEDKVECKKLKRELKEARFSDTFLRMQNERVERDLYWTRVRAREFYQEMIRRGFVFEERPNEAINVLIEYEKSHLSEPRGSPHDAQYVDAAIAAERARQVNVRNDERARQVNVRNDASGSGPISECAKGKKVKFAAATLEGPDLTWWKTKVATIGLETVNQMPWTEIKQLMTAEFCSIEEVQRMKHEMVEPERVKVDAYIRGLTDNIKGEVTSSKPADLNEAVHMAHKLMGAEIAS